MVEITAISDTVEDLDAENIVEELHFTTDEEVTIPLGESVGNQMFVEADHFVAASVEGEQTMNPMEAQMQGIEADDDMVIDQDEETGEITVEVNEAAVFVSNEDAEVGGGVVQVEDGDLDDALDKFEDLAE